MGDVIRQAIIRGHVQGVGFRYWTQRQATKRGLAGWVRNRRDGSVEAVFAGPAEIVAEMLALCRQGPDGARVEAVEDSTGEAAALNARRRGELFSELPTL